MVFIINGYPQSGKDTFVELVQQNLERITKQFTANQTALPHCEVFNISTIDYLKKIFIEQFNWNGVKDKDTRIALALIHRTLTNWRNIPFDLTCKYIQEYNKNNNIIFLHCREPNEIEKYVKAFNAVSIFVINDNAKKIVVNNNINFSKADTEVENYKYDLYVNNNSDFENLNLQAKMFLLDYVFNG